MEALFIYFNLCPSVILECPSCSFTSISFLSKCILCIYSIQMNNTDSCEPLFFFVDLKSKTAAISGQSFNIAPNGKTYK